MRCGSGVRCGRACWGLGFGCAPPLLGGVLGCVCARAPVLRGLLHLLVGVAVRGCVFVRAPRLFHAFPGWGAVCGRASWAPVSAVPRPSWFFALNGAFCGWPGPFVPRPSWLGCRGVFFALFFWACLGLALWCQLLAVPARGLVVPVPPSPFFRAGLLPPFFFPAWCVSACVGVPFPGGLLSWLGVAGFGWVVPLCLFGGPVFGVFWVGGLAASCGVGGRFGGCGLFSRPPPLPPLFFFSGGGLPIPPSAFPGLAHALAGIHLVFRAAVGGCVLLGRVPAPWVGWAMYTLGSAPLPAGLGSGAAGWAAAPGGCVWLWVRGLGLSVSFLLCGASFNLLGGPPPLLPGVRWPRVWPAVLVCGVLVRRLPGCAVGCLRYSFRLGSALPCCAALCRVASRRAVARCTVARCRAVCRAVSRCAVLGQWRSAWPVSWCGVRAGVWLAGGWGVRLGVGVSLGLCCGGLGVPLGLVGWVGVRGVALPGGLCLGPVSSGGPGP